MCAIAGAIGVKDAAYIVRMMLFQMNHRGHVGAGITSCHKGRFYEHRGMGRVDTVFAGVDYASQLPGDMAIGHTRYPTTGNHESAACLQPISGFNRGNPLAVAHNGNLTDYAAWRERLEADGAVFRTESDTELFLHLVAREPGASFDERLRGALRRPKGAWSLLFMSPDAVYAAIDPLGFRPLVMAPYEGGIVFASETCALDVLEAGPHRPLERGMLLKVDAGSLSSAQERLPNPYPFGRKCSFEHVYFSKPDSEAFGLPSQKVREALGRALALAHPAHADLVTSMPDSSNAMAVTYAEALGLPFRHAIIRNHYAGRTFTTPTQVAREFGVRVKLNAIRWLVEGKSVVVVDDSLVRGTTARKAVKLLRRKGAKEVHLRIASPPVVSPCNWGIDTPTHEELLAANATLDDIREFAGADSVGYVPVDELAAAVEDPERMEYCFSCFTGQSPYEPFVPASALVRDRR